MILEEDKDKIMVDREFGLSVQKLCAKYNTEFKETRLLIKERQGSSVFRSYLSKESELNIVKDYIDNELPIYFIAIAYKTSRRVVRGILAQNNIKIRREGKKTINREKRLHEKNKG